MGRRMSETISVEIALALPRHQVLQVMEVEAGATVADVISQSRIQEQLPDVRLDNLATGIWGKPVDRDWPVSDGDRVELYRPLEIDPREARRELANAGLTMRTGRDES